jgi:hypothetical protein
MRLYEFVEDNPLRVKLVAVANQLKSKFTGNEKMSTDAFLKKLKQNDIDLDKSDLFDIVKKEPLSNIISDVNSNEITFKGQDSDQMPTDDESENEKTLKSMASKALKK